MCVHCQITAALRTNLRFRVVSAHCVAANHEWLCAAFSPNIATHNAHCRRMSSVRTRSNGVASSRMKTASALISSVRYLRSMVAARPCLLQNNVVERPISHQAGTFRLCNAGCLIYAAFMIGFLVIGIIALVSNKFLQLASAVMRTERTLEALSTTQLGVGML